MTVSVKEVKNFLRVDHNDDDSLIRSYISAAEALCLDILRTEDRTILKTAKNAKIAVLYAIAYFYEHREEADYKALTISLRALLFGSRKEELLTDHIGNHMSSWNDEFSCYATVGGESGKETAVVGTTVENTDVSFTVRWCALTATVSTTGYRIMFKNEIYDIIAIDHMNYKKKCIKFRCRKARR